MTAGQGLKGQLRPGDIVSKHNRHGKLALSVALLVASNVLVACEGRDKAAAHEAVKAMLKDPNSATFSEENVSKDAICGWYNAKNGYGGYGEKHQYIYVLATKQVHLWVDPNTITSIAGFDAMERAIAAYKKYCHN